MMLETVFICSTDYVTGERCQYLLACFLPRWKTMISRVLRPFFVRSRGFVHYVLVVSLDPKRVSLFRRFTVWKVSLDTRISKR